MWLTVLLILAIIVLAILWSSKSNATSIKSWRTIKKFLQLPQADGFPVLGYPLELATIPLSEFQNTAEDIVNNRTTVDGTAFLFFAGFPAVVTKNAEDLEVFMSSMKHIDKGNIYNILSPWLNEGLLLSTGEKWKQRRRILTPSFHFKILDNNLDSLNKIWRDVARNMLSQNGAPMDPHRLLCRGTLAVITETAMGITLDESAASEKYVSAVRSAADTIGLRGSIFWYYSDIVFNLLPIGWKFKRNIKLLHSFTERVIKERKRTYYQSKEAKSSNGTEEERRESKKPQPFLDALIELDEEQNGILSDSDIQEEVDTFMFEGHDTTAAALLFALFELGLNPNIQEKAYQEQLDIFGGVDRDVTVGDLNQMVYLEQVIKEVLRLYPPVPFMSRNIGEDTQLGSGHVVPAESVIVMFPHLVHQNPKYFPEPKVFNPDRFSPEESANRHPYAFIPFSAGPRNCIGQRFAMMEMKTALSTLLRFTRIKTLNKREDIKLLMLVILRPTQAIKVEITPRIVDD